jgi:mannose-6-phosphate isomerase-like protein (cupin superfamily)
MGHFFSDGEEESRFEVVRAAERTVIPRVISQDGTSHSYFYEALSRTKRNKKMEPFFLTLNDFATNTGTYSHEGEEFIFVMKGAAELILDDERIILAEGDAVYFDSTLKHRLLAAGGKEVKVMAVVMR